MIRAILAILLLFAATASAQMWPSPGPGHAAYGGGGGGEAFTFIASASGGADPSGLAVATSSTLNVAAGDLLVAMVSYEAGGATTVTATDGGSNSLTFDAGEDITEGGGNITVHPGYKLAGSANASATFTATLGAVRDYKRIIVMQYRRAGTETVTKDISGTREASGDSASLLSGSFSTTGTDGVVCALSAVYASGTHSSSIIGGTAADQTKQQNGAYAWCRIVTAGLTTQTASSTYSVSRYWAVTVLGFKSE